MGTNHLRILDDIEAAQERWTCEIEHVTAMLLLEEMLRLYEPGIKFEETLDSIVDSEQSLSEAQRHAYKYVLGREFGRRAAKRKALSTRRKFRPKGRDA